MFSDPSKDAFEADFIDKYRQSSSSAQLKWERAVEWDRAEIDERKIGLRDDQDELCQLVQVPLFLDAKRKY